MAPFHDFSPCCGPLAASVHVWLSDSEPVNFQLVWSRTGTITDAASCVPARLARRSDRLVETGRHLLGSTMEANGELFNRLCTEYVATRICEEQQVPDTGELRLG